MKRVLCLLAFCSLFLSCVKEKEPDHQFGRSTNYTLNVHAVKGGRPDTKALSFDGLKLKATWAGPAAAAPGGDRDRKNRFFYLPLMMKK